MTVPDAVPLAPLPAPFAAVTVQECADPYALLFAVMVAVVAPAVFAVLAVPLVGVHVTLYEVIGAPPSDAGAAHVTEICVFGVPSDAITLVGAPGGPYGVTAFDAVDSLPKLARPCAATVQV